MLKNHRLVLTLVVVGVSFVPPANAMVNHTETLLVDA